MGCCPAGTRSASRAEVLLRSTDCIRATSPQTALGQEVTVIQAALRMPAGIDDVANVANSEVITLSPMCVLPLSQPRICFLRLGEGDGGRGPLPCPSPMGRGELDEFCKRL